jgi:CheY-like chemotaxis protein
MPVLIVDDNETNRFILTEVLRNWRMHPTAVSGGREALDTLLRMSGEGKPFPLVLTDVNMPHMDGYTLAARVREVAEIADTVIIALTSSGRAEDAERRKQVGMAAELLKPVKQSELLNAITVALLPTASEKRVFKPSVTAVALPTKTLDILLAEDGISNQKLAIGLLENWGHRVTVANNGREAVDLWTERPFDLVLMDVQMPDMDGLEATRIIRHRERQTQQHIPIVAMTAHALKGDREKCLDAGMDGYVSKPVRMQELYDAIRPFSGEVQQQAEPQQQPEAGPAQTHKADVDWSAALESVGGDAQLLKEVAQEALAELPRLADQLRQAIEDGNAPTVQRVAHTIKGVARVFCAQQSGHLAETIEGRARDNDLQGLEQLQDRLGAELLEVVSVLEQYVQSGRDASS